jgi:hypothetical protein
MYAGKFATGNEEPIRGHLSSLDRKVQVVGLNELVDVLKTLATRKTYTDDAVVMTVKALAAAGQLRP